MFDSLATIWIPTGRDLHLFSPELALVGTIAAVLLVPLVAGRNAYVTAAVALAGCAVTLMLTGGVAADVASAARTGLAPADATPMLLADNFSVFFKLFLMLFLALVIGLWLIGRGIRGPVGASESGTRQGPPEFFVLLLTSALGMSLMVSTLNLLVILIAIETASLPSYAMAASDKRSRLGAEASLKYVLFGATTAAIMAYGLSLLYGFFGTLDLPTIAARIAANPSGTTLLAAFGLFAFAVGIAFKISAVPFHFWCPDVFEGAPVVVTTWLSVASKGAGLGLLVRIVYTLSGSAPGSPLLVPFAYGIGIVAAVTCTLGNLSALRQDSVKRLLAYSSIAHAGYMMMAAAIFVQPSTGRYTNLGLAAVIAYLLVYLVMNLGAFAVTAMVAWQTGSDRLVAFTGLGRRAPWLALPMAVCLFSLIGLPPLGGFAAKWWLMLALGQAASLQPWLWALVMVLVINTAISLYFYVRVIRQMYLTDDERLPKLHQPAGGVVLVNACAVMLLLLGTLLIHPLGERAKSYASNLFGTPRTTSVKATPTEAREALVTDLQGSNHD
jgi:NADH-quinone oxidoreductase subunit N